MPSAKKTARSRKAAASAKSRGASANKARKASVAGKTASAKAPSKAAQARRKSAARAKSASAKSAAKSASAKASASRTTRKTVKSAAKSAARPASKTSAASKTRAAAKRPEAKRGVAKKSASTRARTAVAAAKTVASKTVASKSHASKVASKKAANPAPAKAAAKPVAPAQIKVVSVKAVKELKTPVLKPANQVANQVLEPSAPRPVAAPAAVPQSVSEPKEVRQNLSQQPVSKPVADIAANAHILARTTAHVRPAPVVQKPSVAAGKARPVSQKLGFKLSEFIVYPAHGVGQIVGIETQEVAGFSLELFVVSFVKDKMILKVPTSKAPAVGMRKLSDSAVVEKALATLTGRARVKRTMWSRRAQEYEAKINSGDLVTIAEVVRDLYRSDTQPEQSYSERQLYEAALDRMAREVAAVRKLIDQEALSLIESFLAKAPRRGPKNEIEGEEDVDRAA